MDGPTIGRKRELKWLPVEKIIKNELNPRQERAFRPEELSSLRHSTQTQGLIDPIMVTPYDDLYKIIDGERRYTTAKLDGVKEVPAYVVPRMTPREEVEVMFNIHTQRRGWEMAEELAAIERLMEENSHLSHQELAKQLGMSLRTFKDRLDLINMGPVVKQAIARREVDPYVALRAGQAAEKLSKHRPEMTERLGGDKAVRDKLLKKGKSRKGMTRELEQINAEARDTDVTPDSVLEAYVNETDLTLQDARRKTATLSERRAVEDLAKRVSALERELRAFRIDLDSAPNLRELRRSLSSLAETAAHLELRVAGAMRDADVSK